jgi:hypothetical protein
MSNQGSDHEQSENSRRGSRQTSESPQRGERGSRNDSRPQPHRDGTSQYLTVEGFAAALTNFASRTTANAIQASDEYQDPNISTQSSRTELIKIRVYYAELAVNVLHLDENKEISGIKFCGQWSHLFHQVVLYSNPEQWTDITGGNSFLVQKCFALRKTIDHRSCVTLDAMSTANTIREVAQKAETAFNSADPVEAAAAANQAVERVISSVRVNRARDQQAWPFLQFVKNFSFIVITSKIAAKLNRIRWRFASGDLMRRLFEHVRIKFDTIYNPDPDQRSLATSVENAVEPKSNYKHLFQADFEAIPDPTSHDDRREDRREDRRRQRSPDRNRDHNNNNSNNNYGGHQQRRHTNNQRGNNNSRYNNNYNDNSRSGNNGHGDYNNPRYDNNQGNNQGRNSSQHHHHRQQQHRDDGGYHDSYNEDRRYDNRNDRVDRADRGDRDDRPTSRGGPRSASNHNVDFDPNRHCKWCHANHHRAFASHRTSACRNYEPDTGRSKRRE